MRFALHSAVAVAVAVALLFVTGSASGFRPVYIGKTAVVKNDRADVVRKLAGPPTQVREFAGHGRIGPGVQ
jgi:hypothetical protein